VLLRRVRALDGPARLVVTLNPRADYDRRALRDAHRRHGVWTARVGDLYLRWTGAEQARPRENGETLRFELDLDEGAQHDLVLELGDRPLPDDPPDPDAAWRATASEWNTAVPGLADSLAPLDSRHTYAVLRGMTDNDGGGMVAAATTSLPERAE